MAINAKIDLKKPVLEEISAQVRRRTVRAAGKLQRINRCSGYSAA